ncbi:MAG: NAD(P)-binding domain-containing protein, partial [Nitrosopumilaceae archaeon]
MDEASLQKMKNICVLGLGYVGLPTALILAKQGFRVLGVDISDEKVNMLKKGKCPISDAEEIFNDDVVKKNVEFSFTPSQSDVFIIAVPTPLLVNEKKSDLS